MQEAGPFVPVDFKFRPSDEELIGYYLHRKVSGMPIPYVDCIVKECDLYGDHEPGVIWNSYGGTLLNEDEDLYFFTKLKKKNPKSSRINRKVGSGAGAGAGAWQGEDAPTKIVSRKSQKLIGSKKRFRYEKKNSVDDGLWIMHEYTLDSSLLGQNHSTNYVLCRIRKNQLTGSRKEKRSGLAKKRKLKNFQNRSNQSECQCSETSMVTMVQQDESCNTDMMSKQSFQRSEGSGFDYTSGTGAGQQTVMLQQEESSDDDPLSRIPEEDFCMLRKMFPADEFDNQPIGVNGPSAGVDWLTMPRMQERLCELPKLMSEEYVCVLSDDGDSAGSTNSSVDMMMNQQRFSDHGRACDCEGILQRGESAAVVPMVFPDQSVGVFGESMNSMADMVMVEQEISLEDCEGFQQFLLEENHQEEEQFFHENFTNLT